MQNEKYLYAQDRKNLVGGLIKKHNLKVKEEFKKAEKGEIIDLTALMISKERIAELSQ